MNALDSLRTLFSPPGDPSLLAIGTYDPLLVVLSVLVAVFASAMALRLAAEAGSERRLPLRITALITGSLALGAGVWAMHFVGMLSFRICAVRYDRALTLWSMLPSVAASTLAFWLIARRDLRRWQLIGGGIAVGAGIGAMHYTGMAAMRMSAALRYDPVTFVLSIAVAIALAMLALWVRFGLRRTMLDWTERRRSAASAVVMGVAIAGMHYTGMAAARFVGPVNPGTTTNASFIALAIAGITIAFTLLVMITNAWLQKQEMVRLQSEREAQWRGLLATAPDGVIVFDADGRIDDCNPSAEAIFARNRAGLIGADIHDLIDGGGPLRTGEALALRPDTTTVPIRLGIGGAPQACGGRQICFVTDIRQRREMEQALRDSERQMRSLIGNIPGISYRCEISGDWPAIFISDAVERLTGYPASDFLGPGSKRRFIDLVHPDDRESLRARVAEAVRESRPYVLEYRITHRDGRERFMWGCGGPVPDAQGRQRFLDGVILDMTDRHRMEQELRAAKERAEHAAAARAAFLANMSHEIRTPMNSIIGFSDVLLQGSTTAEQRHQLLIVNGSARSLLRLLNEILDTAKLDKGLVELEVRNFDLAALIDELIAAHSVAARARGLVLSARREPGLPLRYRGDALRIRQVLANLLSNAIKFTPSGSVDLEVAGRDGQLHFQVRDTGIGIPAARLGAIFDPFMQADPSMSRRYGGTGLGTTISRQLVELMGGRIWVESTEGVGSCFHVLLPLSRTEDPVELSARHRLPVPLPALRILAVDDAMQNLELLNLVLGAHGHTVLTASDGAMAVRLAARERFDVVLMDLQMPGMDGLGATRAIRAREVADGSRRVPIVALSASVLSEDRHAAIEAGMDAFATKPVDMLELSRQIAALLGLPPVGAAAPASRMPAPAPRGGPDLPSVRSLVARLACSLRGGALDADALSMLQAQLRDRVEPSRLAEIQHLVDQFEFLDAGERLDALCSELEAQSTAA